MPGKTFFEMDTRSLPEIEATETAIARLQDAGILRAGHLIDHQKFELLRAAVRTNYEITWTSIRPPMERLLYSLGAVNRPLTITAIGIFCGNTLTWNTGCAAGPGKCYDADKLIGVEIEREPCELAGRNLESIGIRDQIDLRCEDGHKTLDGIDYPLELLYLDANGPLPGTTEPTKLIYLSLLQRIYDRLPKGAIVVAHDTIIESFLRHAQPYLDFVRDPAHFTASASIIPDDLGVEISVK